MSRPMFLLMPLLLENGIHFWWSLLICIGLTVICFIITGLVADRFGVDLIP